MTSHVTSCLDNFDPSILPEVNNSAAIVSLELSSATCVANSTPIMSSRANSYTNRTTQSLSGSGGGGFLGEGGDGGNSSLESMESLPESPVVVESDQCVAENPPVADENMSEVIPVVEENVSASAVVSNEEIPCSVVSTSMLCVTNGVADTFPTTAPKVALVPVVTKPASAESAVAHASFIDVGALTLPPAVQQQQQLPAEVAIVDGVGQQTNVCPLQFPSTSTVSTHSITTPVNHGPLFDHGQTGLVPGEHLPVTEVLSTIDPTALGDLGVTAYQAPVASKMALPTTTGTTNLLPSAVTVVPLVMVRPQNSPQQFGGKGEL